MKSLRTWLDPQGENTEHWWNFGITCGRRMDWWISQRLMVFWLLFFSEQVLFCYFRKKKMNRPFLPWQVCLEVPSWESLVLRHSQQVHLLSIRIDPSRADNGSIWQNTNVSALLWHVRDCPLQKFLPKISPIEVFRAPQASTTPCSSLQKWTFWATCSLPLDLRTSQVSFQNFRWSRSSLTCPNPSAPTKDRMKAHQH